MLLFSIIARLSDVWLPSIFVSAWKYYKFSCWMHIFKHSFVRALASRGTFPCISGVNLQIESRTAGTSPFHWSLLNPVYTLIYFNFLFMCPLKIYSHVLLYQLSTRWYPLLVSHVEISYNRTLCIEMYSILEIRILCIEMESILEICYLILLYIICANLPAKVLLKMYTFGILSKFWESLMRNNFTKRPSGELLHSTIKV